MESFLKREHIALIEENSEKNSLKSSKIELHQMYSNWLNYVSLSKNFDFTKLKSSDHIGIKIYHDATYFGEIKNGLRNGRGIMKYSNGRVYEGEWINDKREGKGYEKFQNENTYEGYYLNGKPNGSGTYVWSTGEIYHGEWINGVKQGKGVWKGIKGDSFVGEFRNNKANGTGIQRLSKNRKY